MANQEVQVLEQVLEIDYKWNPGAVVGRFLTDLRDRGEITAIRCTKTSKVFLPPQSWSPYGQIKMDRFVTVGGTPTLLAGTIVHQKPWNAPEGIETPYMLASIGYPGVDNGLIHIVCASLGELRALKPGTALAAVWKEERTGTIRDIDHFVPKDRS